MDVLHRVDGSVLLAFDSDLPSAR